MSKTPNYDQKVRVILDNLVPGERTCAMTGETWVMDEEEIAMYRQFNVPPSPLSPKGRLWHLSAYWTAYQWWWNRHFDTGAPVLTYVHPATGIRVLPDKEWFARDFSDTFLEPSLEASFFDQFRTLQLRVPVNATRNVKEPENSIATISVGDTNSYFVHASRTKNCAYTADCMDAESCVECSGCVAITDCYQVGHSQRMHRCSFSNESTDCISSAFLFDCRNCENCFGASNKRNKKYLWWNEQLSKEEWERRIAEVVPMSYNTLQAMREKYMSMIRAEAVWPENFNQQSENCIGDYLLRCTNCKDSWFGMESHDNYHCFGFYNSGNNAYATIITGENNYQGGMNGDSSNTKFSASLIRCDDCEYSFNCYDCTHCFGCVGLRHKSFCIFNKQYTEADYWQKVDALKCAMLERGEYGRPLPMAFTFSYFPESGTAMYLGAEPKDWDRIGMPKFEASADGAFGALRTGGKPARSATELPETIAELDPEEWAGVPIEDPELNRPFTLLKPEMEFYKKNLLPPPRQHFIARMRNLMWMQNTGLKESIACSQCQKQMTVYISRLFKERKVYCSECYLRYLETNG